MDNTPLTDVSGSMVRHPKWEKVEAGYEFLPGELRRYENEYGAVEHRRDYPFTDHGDGYAYFRDTTWQESVEPLKVGDIIETVDDLRRLPLRSGFVDYHGDLWQVAYDTDVGGVGAELTGGFWEDFYPIARDYFPFTIVHIPNSGGPQLTRTNKGERK